jgi:membrane protease YdiL (CAAX protease family)
VKAIRTLVIYLLVVFAGGALLAPALWHAAQWADQTHPSPNWHRLANYPFHRYMDRSFLILGLAGLWPLLRGLGVRDWRDLGLISPHGQGGRFLGGLALGLITLGPVAVLAIIVGGRPVDSPLTAAILLSVTGKALTAALPVALFEEMLFRGGLFLGLRRHLPWPWALVVSSVIYAVVHFLRHGELAGAAHWNSGLLLLPDLFGSFAQLALRLPDLVSLTMAGLLLGLACQRTGNLYCSMGIHGAWVFALKFFQKLTEDPAGPPSALWGTTQLIDGWAAGLLLGLVFVIWMFRSPNPHTTPAPTESTAAP